jgi:branched-chain amino acid transport system permease protein
MLGYPLLAIVLIPVAILLDITLCMTIFKRLKASPPSPAVFESNSMLFSFGLLFIIQNIALIAWGPELRTYYYLRVPVNLAGAQFGAIHLVTGGFALAIGLAFYVFLARTRLGKAIRAAAQDPATAGLLGVNINRVLALCFGLGAGLAAMAGVLISTSYSVLPVMGLEYTVIAMIVVVLGGLGSIPGSFIGGLILGLIGSIVTSIKPSLAVVAYYAIFILLLLVKPTGIMGRQRE